MGDAASNLGLVLTGGGARAAYQVGVLKGISELIGRGAHCPFQVVTGSSAGAVSAIAIASDPQHFRRSVKAIERVWREFRMHHVIKSDPFSVCRSGLHWLSALLSGGWLTAPPRSLFDNAPLWDLLRKNLDFEGIPRGLYKKHLHAVGISATSYRDADSVTFYACSNDMEPWTRALRRGVRVHLTLDHLMASLALPFLFRPIRLEQQFYGDGAMRQTSPLSPALHLGAERLMVIGVGDPAQSGIGMRNPNAEPSFGQMFGFMLDSLFMDHLHADLERIQRYNRGPQPHRLGCLVITPSQDLAGIARRHRRELPLALRMLLRVMGADNSAGNQLLSYLLFERGYTTELIALGRRDAHTRAAEIRSLLGSHARGAARTHAASHAPDLSSSAASRAG